MKSTHQRGMTATTLWAHLSEVPDEIRKVLEAEIEAAEIEDKAIIHATVSAIRSSRLAMRVPKMCRALRLVSPEMPLRRVFVAVSLRTGLSEGHIRDLFYAERKKL